MWMCLMFSCDIVFKLPWKMTLWEQKQINMTWIVWPGQRLCPPLTLRQFHQHSNKCAWLKLQVEQHNRQIQQSFAQRMDGAFSTMQRRLQQQESKQHDMLSSYSQAIGKTREPRLSSHSAPTPNSALTFNTFLIHTNPSAHRCSFDAPHSSYF